MKKPVSTYRLQLNSDFTFKDVNNILDYLEQLGVTTIYSAPFFQAREGSTHGYDVTDPFTLNREIGKLEDFRTLRERMRGKNMSWLQDIVPNHMAYDPGNIWLKDIFELGPDSDYYHFFDIDWKYKGWNKVMAPFLGAPLEEILDKNEIKIKFSHKGFSINYYDNIYPASARSYTKILMNPSLTSWRKIFEDFKGNSEEFHDLKISFFKETEGDKVLRQSLVDSLNEINNSQKRIKEILELQFFKPVYWKRTEKEINYRRFFTINDLICLRMEDQKVFDTYHSFIKELCDAGMINGLRIDHIDGLFDPEGYLHKLRQLVGDDFYIVIEKILEAEEKLPGHWPAEGTSGYEFLAVANHILTDSKNREEFEEEYNEIAGDLPAYEDLVHEKKLFILKERMAGELHNLWEILKEKNLLPDEELQKEEKYKEALSAFLAGFPVYRIYPNSFPLTSLQLKLIDEAFYKAKENLQGYNQELKHLKDLLTGENDKDLAQSLYFLQRCQQFSGPLAAKGVEDTAFYIFNKLVSHNEVGDSPENFGITAEEYHKKMLERKKNFPFAINTTATHDTKRGEDARMRLNVLSEIPQEWFSKVEEWKKINSPYKKNAPDDNEEYFIYQILIAAMPFKEEKDFLSRTNDSLRKGLREAKVNSNWGEPDEKYEQEIFDFVQNILNDKNFRKSFDPFFEKIAAFGAIKSLSQILLKLTSPGIPDVYQGTELWDLSYVDPDNRRPVDYNIRNAYLSEFKLYNTDNLNSYLKEIREDYRTAKIKMYSLYTALRERKNEPNLFLEGEYLPIKIIGAQSDNFICYARHLRDSWIIIVLPTLVTELYERESLLPKEDITKHLKILLPDNVPDKWFNAFTGETILADGEISLHSLLSNFPIALLKNKH